MSVWLSASAAAQSPQLVTLSYEATPPGCPAEQTFRDTVAARLGYDPFVAWADVHASVEITASPAGLIGRLRIIDAEGAVTGARDIEGMESECSEVAVAVAVSMSILLDPFGLGREEPATSEEPVSVAPDPEPPPVEAAPIEPGRDVGFTLYGAVGSSLGLAPGPTLGPLFGLGLSIERVSVALEGRAEFMPHPATADSGDRLEASVFTAGPSVCVAFGLGRLCAAFHLGAFQGRGVDVVDPVAQASFFASMHVHGGIDVPLTRVLALRARLELRAPIVRTSLLIDGAGVWTAPALAGGLNVGLMATVL